MRTPYFRIGLLGTFIFGVALSLVGAACGDGALEGDTGSVQSGLYFGSDVTFRVADGKAYDFRFSHIECRIPHPDNADVALCLKRPDGQPDDVLVMVGSQLSGQVGDVVIEGSVSGSLADGTWSFESMCHDGSSCVAEGVWTAEWKAEPGGSQPALPPDEGAPPTGSESSLGESGGASSTPEDDEPAVGSPRPDATELQLSAWEAFEAVRLAAGLPMPGQDKALNAAAQAHADYYALHVASYQATGLNPHEENAEWEEGFSGVGIGDRLAFHGAQGGSGWGEVMAFTGTASGAVHGWVDTLYHRIPFVHPNTMSWGFGIAEGQTKCEVMDYSLGAPLALGSSHWANSGQLGVPWPPPDAVEVDTSWNGAESPQPPLPEGQSYPSGPVITLTFATGTSLQLESASLVDGGGGEVPIQVQTPDNDPWLSSTWSIYAFSPLDPSTTYTVSLKGLINGDDYDGTWSFSTR